jgi:hypothetical protein
MAGGHSSETSISTYNITLCYNPEDKNLKTKTYVSFYECKDMTRRTLNNGITHAFHILTSLQIQQQRALIIVEQVSYNFAKCLETKVSWPWVSCTGSLREPQILHLLFSPQVTGFYTCQCCGKESIHILFQNPNFCCNSGNVDSSEVSILSTLCELVLDINIVFILWIMHETVHTKVSRPSS